MAPRRRRAQKQKVPYIRQSKTKKLVTGQDPTLLERLASQANNIGLVAKSILPIAMAINTEHKYFDYQSSGVAYNPGTNDSLINLSQAIAQGLTDQTRIGNSILAKDMQMTILTDFLPAVAGLQTAYGRFTLLVWKENLQDNPPTVAKIFEFPSLFHSRFNKDYTDQMVIIKDKIIPYQASTLISQVQSPHVIKLFKKLDFHMRFDGAGTTDGTVNHIYLCVRGWNATSANQVNYNQYFRLNYTDN